MPQRWQLPGRRAPSCRLSGCRIKSAVGSHDAACPATLPARWNGHPANSGAQTCLRGVLMPAIFASCCQTGLQDPPGAAGGGARAESRPAETAGLKPRDALFPGALAQLSQNARALHPKACQCGFRCLWISQARTAEAGDRFGWRSPLASRSQHRALGSDEAGPPPGWTCGSDRTVCDCGESGLGLFAPQRPEWPLPAEQLSRQASPGSPSASTLSLLSSHGSLFRIWRRVPSHGSSRRRCSGRRGWFRWGTISRHSAGCFGAWRLRRGIPYGERALNDHGRRRHTRAAAHTGRAPPDGAPSQGRRAALLR